MACTKMCNKAEVMSWNIAYFRRIWIPSEHYLFIKMGP